MLLVGKTAVVYGAAGSVGSAVARAFAREGASVVLAGRTQAALEGVAAAPTGRWNRDRVSGRRTRRDFHKPAC